jgi:hypothetical protein
MTRDGVHGEEDVSSERTTQQHAMGKHGSGRYFERDGETQRGSRLVGPW